MHVIIGKIKKPLAIKDADSVFFVNILAGFSDELVYVLISLMAARMVTPRALAGVTIITPIYYFAMILAVMISKSTALSVQTALGNFTKKEAGCYLANGIQAAVLAGAAVLIVTSFGSDAYFNAVGVSQQTVDYATEYLTFGQFGYMLIPICKTISEYIGLSSNKKTILLSRAVLILSNTLLSYILCKKMGLMGIGLAFTIGYIAHLCVLARHFMSEHNSVRPVQRKIEMHRMDSIKRSIPGGMTQISGLLTTVCINALIVRNFGVLSEDVLAYMSVFANILIASTIYQAIPDTCCALINLYNVENNEITIEELIRHSMIVSSAIAILLSVITIIFAPYLPILFNVSELEYTEEFVIAVRVFAAFFIVRSIYINYSCFQVALGHHFFSAALEFLKEFIAPTLVVTLFVKTFGAIGLFIGMSVYPFFTLILLYIGVRLYTKHTDKYSFPWLFSNTNVDPIVYEMNVTMDNVIDLRNRVGKYLLDSGVSKASSLKTELVVEEFGTLLLNSNKDTVLTEWDIYIYDDLIELVVRDDGSFIDFSRDDATAGLSAYVLSCVMPTYGEIHYAMASSENRHRFQIER